jgi:hypothetical protein
MWLIDLVYFLSEVHSLVKHVISRGNSDAELVVPSLYRLTGCFAAARPID